MAMKLVFENGQQKIYSVICNAGVDPQTGNPHLKQKLFRTNEEANEFLENLSEDEKQVSFQISVDQKMLKSNSCLFNQFAKIWFYGDETQGIKPATFRQRQIILDKHVIPYFGEKHLDEITENDIEGFYVKKRQEGYSEKMIMEIQTLLKNLLRSAVKNGYLDKDPMKGMKEMIKESSSKFIPWSHDEITRLLQVANLAGEGMMYEFELETGLRLGELLGLTWKDIDFDKKSVTISKNASHYGTGKRILEEIRSGSRTISLSPFILSKLKEHKEEQQLMKVEVGNYSQGQLDLVFPKKNGGIQNPSIIQAKFNRLIEKANVRKITFHDLRKMHAIMLFKVGVSLDIIERRLGYGSVETTLGELYKSIS
jgi:integrase